MKQFIVRVAVLLVVGTMLISIPAAALTIYNVNGDTDAYGRSVIDVCDLVRAEKFSTQSSDTHGTYNSSFLLKLRRFILKIDELPDDHGSIGDIYLPEAP